MGKEYTRGYNIESIRQIGGTLLSYFDFTTMPFILDYIDGTTGLLQLSQDYKLHDTSSLQMRSQHVGAADGDQMLCTIRIPRAPAGLFKLQLAFLLPDVSQNEHIIFTFSFLDGTNRYHAALKYDVTNTKLQYKNSTGSYTDVTSDTIALSDECWYYTELIGRFDKNEYVSCKFINNEYDLSGNSFHSSNTTGNGYCKLDIEGETNSANPAEIFVDYIAISEEL